MAEELHHLAVGELDSASAVVAVEDFLELLVATAEADLVFEELGFSLAQVLELLVFVELADGREHLVPADGLECLVTEEASAQFLAL